MSRAPPYSWMAGRWPASSEPGIVLPPNLWMGSGECVDERRKSMAVEKEHKEFFRLNFSEGWEPIPGYPPGMEHKILAGHLDEANKRGARTRLMRIPAGTFTTKPFIHEY